MTTVFTFQNRRLRRQDRPSWQRRSWIKVQRSGRRRHRRLRRSRTNQVIPATQVLIISVTS